MPLELTYTLSSKLPVEIDGIVPNALSDLTLPEIERLQVQHGNGRLALADAFKIGGGAADEHLRFSGDLSGVHRIGAGMTSGRIDVVGSVGRHAGSQMVGGELHISGDAGDWLGAEMRGGSILVRGDAGNRAGAAYPGSERGMTGGAIAVAGNVGDECGHTMRRGLIAVGGNCGDFAGINMIAGSLVVFGECGARVGAAMRRGTIALLGPWPPRLLPTFRPSCRLRPIALALLLREIRRLGLPAAPELGQAEYWLYHGDSLTIGRGEIWSREQPVEA
ncbi:MAG TPA: formylmethanofuran dehydrogenase subunit C [Pirellulales bacterium]|nr:formylmethanofuran dehydrogenase subunit C [Pirellulales bacterium]